MRRICFWIFYSGKGQLKLPGLCKAESVLVKETGPEKFQTEHLPFQVCSLLFFLLKNKMHLMLMTLKLLLEFLYDKKSAEV